MPPIICPRDCRNSEVSPFCVCMYESGNQTFYFLLLPNTFNSHVCFPDSEASVI